MEGWLGVLLALFLVSSIARFGAAAELNATLSLDATDGVSLLFTATGQEPMNLTVCTYEEDSGFEFCAFNHNYRQNVSYRLNGFASERLYYYAVVAQSDNGIDNRFWHGNFTLSNTGTVESDAGNPVLIFFLAIAGLVSFAPIDNRKRLFILLPVVLALIIVLVSLLI